MLAPSTAPTTPFTSQGACVKHAAQGGKIVRVVTSRVSIAVGPLFRGYCPVTITLLNAVAGLPVSISATLQNGKQFCPTLTASDTQEGRRISTGEYFTSATAQLLTSDPLSDWRLRPRRFPHQPMSWIMTGGYPVLGDQDHGGRSLLLLRQERLSNRFTAPIRS